MIHDIVHGWVVCKETGSCTYDGRRDSAAGLERETAPED